MTCVTGNKIRFSRIVSFLSESYEKVRTSERSGASVSFRMTNLKNILLLLRRRSLQIRIEFKQKLVKCFKSANILNSEVFNASCFKHE